ncbi:hypothetical protein PG993_000247 [Apiospora rasikravindrae]|uniref:Uncharacterized protein n=1 Tax=Apiospora rasikravindrae TaxID=990691 RepID=A0ABR1U801_9PEZI
MSERQAYRAAVVSAINDAISKDPHTNLTRGMAEEVEVGRSDDTKQPSLVLYAKQKDQDATFTTEMENLKNTLLREDIAPNDEMLDDSTAFEVRFVRVYSDNGGVDSPYIYKKGGQGNSAAGGRRYTPAPPPRR